MSGRLQDKVAVVTGAGRGIGRGEAMAMANEGAKVVVNDLGGGADGEGDSSSPADEVVEEIKAAGGEAVANYDSVATWEGGHNIIQTAIDSFGRIDILVNNAGILRDRMVFNMTEEEFDIIMKVHIYGHFFTIRAACSHFRKQRSGRIINTSSAAGLGVTFGQANYGAAKEAIIGLTRQVANDMGRYGVTCNAIRPAAATRMTLNEDLIKAWERAGMTDLVQKQGQNKPDDIASLIVWLASDDALNVNGRTFSVSTGKIGLYSEPVEEKMLVRSGPFTVDELFEFMPENVTGDLINPNIPKEDTEE